jgi:AbrB family looped-hinge helix DNA binding protein
MQTKVSAKGQVVLPKPIRQMMGLRAGDPLEARIEGDRIVLIPSKKRSRKGRIIKDPATGLPVLTAGAGAPKITSAEVKALLADFP